MSITMVFLDDSYCLFVAMIPYTFEFVKVWFLSN